MELIGALVQGKRRLTVFVGLCSMTAIAMPKILGFVVYILFELDRHLPRFGRCAFQ